MEAGWAHETLPAGSIERDATFEGLFSFQGSARIEGRLRGEVWAHGVLGVGETASVEARIEVDELVVSGRVKGEIRARVRVELLPGARVRGRIHTPRLAIAEGASLNASLRMAPGQSTRGRPGSGRAGSP